MKRIVLLIGALILAPVAFADDPGWKTGVKITGINLATSVFFLVRTEPSMSDLCGGRTPWVRVHWPDATAGAAVQRYVERSLALLKDAMNTHADVDIYLQEHFDSSGRMYCSIPRIQVYPSVQTAGVGNNGGNGDDGGGDDGGGDDGGSGGGDADWIVGLAKSTHSDGRRNWIGFTFRRTEAAARERALEFCREEAEVSDTCQVLGVMPRSAHRGRPYCFAVAESQDTRAQGWAYIASGTRQTAQVARDAVSHCRDAGGTSCAILWDPPRCVGYASGSAGTPQAEDQVN